MRIIRTPLKLERPTQATYVLQRLGAMFPVRSLYLEKESVPSGLPDYIAVRVILDDSGAMGRFAQFLEERVKNVDDDEAKITIGQIWDAWAGTHGADPSETDIAGIRRSDVGEFFRDRFNEGDLTRGRVDGRVQLCWRGYRIVDAGSRDQTGM
ncbi:MAG: hypothetical protein OXC95_03055 [Dehalococcoidia bacterium]|nr:hypothetical protein [Dehalococcoidia bacterium]